MLDIADGVGAVKPGPDYYRVLHVHPDAPVEVIRASHRTLMQGLRMHPDLGGDHAQAVLLNEACDTLTDPVRRAAYDRARQETTPLARPSTPAAPEAVPARPAAPVPTPPYVSIACAFCGTPAPPTSLEWPEAACCDCGSALYPAKKHHVGERSRRTIERLPRNLAMTFRRSTSRHVILAGITEDVSLNGSRFNTHADVKVGDRLSIECQFCSSVATVRRVRAVTEHGARRFEVGVEFMTLRIKNTRGGLISTVA